MSAECHCPHPPSTYTPVMSHKQQGHCSVLLTIAALHQAFSFSDSLAFRVRGSQEQLCQGSRYRGICSHPGKSACPSLSDVMELFIPGPSRHHLAPNLYSWNFQTPQIQREPGAQWILEIVGPLPHHMIRKGGRES